MWMKNKSFKWFCVCKIFPTNSFEPFFFINISSFLGKMLMKEISFNQFLVGVILKNQLKMLTKKRWYFCHFSLTFQPNFGGRDFEKTAENVDEKAGIFLPLFVDISTKFWWAWFWKNSWKCRRKGGDIFTNNPAISLTFPRDFLIFGPTKFGRNVDQNLCFFVFYDL